MELFYQPEGIAGTRLSEVESRYCLRLLRKKEGDKIRLVDGKGNFIQAVISDTEHQICAYQITEHEPQLPLDYYVQLAVAPTKNQDRMEWLVEKAVEIGVNEFSFICCQHSERKQLNMERLQKKSYRRHEAVSKSLLTSDQSYAYPG